MAKRTAEEVCIEYAIAAMERRKQHAILCAQTCEKIVGWDAEMASGKDPEENRPDTCLDVFFSAPRGPDGEFPRHKELIAALKAVTA